MEQDTLNRRWRRANKRARGGWSRRSQWYADQQQGRLLRREQRRLDGVLRPMG